MTEPLLRIENLTKHYHERSHTIHAVNGIDFEVYPGEAVGLVGESGCGKSTTARCVLRLEEPTSGHVYFNDVDLTTLSSKHLRAMRKEMQMVFQDPHESLNPRFTVRRTLREPLALHGLYQDAVAVERRRRPGESGPRAFTTLSEPAQRRAEAAGRCGARDHDASAVCGAG